MDEYPRFESSAESSDDDDEKPKAKKAKRIGALTSFSFEKGGSSSAGSKKEKPETDTTIDDVLRHNVSEKPKESQEKTDTELGPDIEAAKLDALKEQLAVNIPRLETEIATTEPGSVENLAAQATLKIENGIREKIEDPTAEADPAIDAEFDRRLAELEVADDEDEGASKEVAPDILGEALEALDEAEELQASSGASTSVNPIPVSAAAPATPAHRGTNTIISTTPPPLRSPQTPNPPAPPSASIPVATGGNLPPLPLTFGGAPNITPRAIDPNAYRSPTTRQEERSKKAGAFLAGGVLGYMLGRRGGRKRTEARLQPEVDKFKQEAESTKQHLKIREKQFKKSVEELRQERLVSVPKLNEREKSPRAETSPRTVERTPTSELLRQTVVIPEAMKKVDENLGVPRFEAPPEIPRQEVAVTEQTIREVEPKVEAKPKQAVTPEITIRRIEQLSTPEILHRAESLFINGVSVKELYNTNRIDRTGLITIVQESMRGNSIKDSFEKIELGQERQRERAREFRHDDPSFTTSSATSMNDSKPAITATPVEPAPHYVASVPNNPDPTSLQPVDTRTSPTQSTREQPFSAPQEKTPKPTIRLGFSALIVITLILLLVLYFTR